MIRFTLCILRRLRNKDDKYNSIIAGVVASFTVMLESDLSTRKLIILYTFARSIESLILTLDSNNIMKERKDWGLLLFMIMISILVFHYSANPGKNQYNCIDIVGKGLVNLVNKVGDQKTNDKIIAGTIFPILNQLY